MRMDETSPVEALRKPARPIRVALLVGAGALVIAGTTWGGIAIAQSGQADEAPLIADEPSQTPTPETPNVAPVVAIDAPTVSDLTVTVTGTSSDEDGEVASQGWNFGDGTYGDGASGTHTYGTAGTYTITFAVTDDDGASASATVEVTVTAPPPPPPAPPAAAQCPAGSIPNSVENGVHTSCIWEVCLGLTLPDPTHPECDAPFRP